MAVRTTARKNALAAAYIAAGPYSALFSADPGSAGSASTELTGGSPAYNRKALNWSAPANGASTGNATHDVASGSTVAWAGNCASVTPGTADVGDSVSVTSQPFVSQGQYTITQTVNAA